MSRNLRPYMLLMLLLDCAALASQRLPERRLGTLRVRPSINRGEKPHHIPVQLRRASYLDSD